MASLVLKIVDAKNVKETLETPTRELKRDSLTAKFRKAKQSSSKAVKNLSKSVTKSVGRKSILKKSGVKVDEKRLVASIGASPFLPTASSTLLKSPSSVSVSNHCIYFQ